MTTVVLVHSPLMGSFSWSLVAAELRQRGWQVVVPNLHEDGVDERQSFHEQHAQNAANVLQDIQPDEPVVLIAHSGAGPLLPAICQKLCQPVVAYLFVDAGIAHNGQSRLDMLAEELPDVAPKLRKLLADGKRWPQWQDQDLAEAVPNAERRRKLLTELTPQPLAFFDETIPVFTGWPDAPCAYLQFSAGYNYSAAEAKERGWLYGRLEAGHFHMLVDETAVADHILQLLSELYSF